MKFPYFLLPLCLCVLAAAVLLVATRDPRRCVQQRSALYLGTVRVDICLYGHAAGTGLARVEEMHRVLTNVGGRPLELVLWPDPVNHIHPEITTGDGRRVHRSPMALDMESGGPKASDFRKVVLAAGENLELHYRLRDLLREAPVAGQSYRIRSTATPFYRLLDEGPLEGLDNRLREELDRREPSPWITFDSVAIE